MVEMWYPNTHTCLMSKEWYEMWYPNTHTCKHEWKNGRKCDTITHIHVHMSEEW